MEKTFKDQTRNLIIKNKNIIATQINKLKTKKTKITTKIAIRLKPHILYFVILLMYLCKNIYKNIEKMRINNNNH